jgi:hypothetical protein
MRNKNFVKRFAKFCWPRYFPHKATTTTASAIDLLSHTCRVDKKWRFQLFAKYDYRLLDLIIAIIASFFANATIAILQLLPSISHEQ